MKNNMQASENFDFIFAVLCGGGSWGACTAIMRAYRLLRTSTGSKQLNYVMYIWQETTRRNATNQGAFYFCSGQRRGRGKEGLPDEPNDGENKNAASFSV